MRWLIVLAATLPGCVYFDSKDPPGSCANQACTDLFAMVTVQIENTANAPVTGLTTRSFYLDGNQEIMTYQSGLDNGHYVVVDDNFLGQALDDRDHHSVHFEAKSATQTVTADYVILAGECTCHVDLVSGPLRLVMP